MLIARSPTCTSRRRASCYTAASLRRISSNEKWRCRRAAIRGPFYAPASGRGGKTEEYARLRGGWAAGNAGFTLIPGNHDAREGLRELRRPRIPARTDSCTTRSRPAGALIELDTMVRARIRCLVKRAARLAMEGGSAKAERTPILLMHIRRAMLASMLRTTQVNEGGDGGGDCARHAM